MFGASIGNMFTDDGVKFSQESIDKFKTRINDAIDVEVKK